MCNALRHHRRPLYTQTDSPTLSSLPQGIDACCAELEEIELGQRKLAARKAKVEAVIANDHGRPTNVSHLSFDNLGALLHSTTHTTYNAMPRDGRAPP